MRFILVSGLSGSGKSVALHMLEDLGYYCVDNIPAHLLSTFVNETVSTAEPTYQNTAVGVDARNREADIASVPDFVRELKARGINCEVIFLHAERNILLKRYSETRRKHPLSGATSSLRDAIDAESALLEPIANDADLIIDTTRTSVHDLRELIRDRVHGRRDDQLSLQFSSFGYKNGVPADADFVFDLRCLPNPYWEHALRSQTGKDEAVAAFLDGQDAVQRMMTDIVAFLDRWLPEYERGSRSYMTVALGCTGGQHRSVYFADRLAGHYASRFDQTFSRHRELR